MTAHVEHHLARNAGATKKSVGDVAASGVLFPLTLTTEAEMELGAFSVSLTVKDLEASRAFYEKLGFTQTGGNPAHGWVILVNGPTVIGLFKGMFDKNILTFNPGWKGAGEAVAGDFTDVREIARRLEEAGVELTSKQLPEEGGPAHITLVDPDGNPVLIDQHR